MGIVLANLDEGPVREHLMLNAERLTSWQVFRTELEQITRLRSFAGGPMANGIGTITVAKSARTWLLPQYEPQAR